MSLLNTRFQLCWICLILPLPAAAAEPADALQDVAAAFQQSTPQDQLLTFSCGELEFPPGGHLQGVQLKADPQQRRWLVFLSHDSRRYGYVLVVEFAWDLDRPGKLIHVHPFPEGRLRHAGGIQLCDHLLAVGLEDNWTRDQSEIQFWDIRNPAQWKPLEHLTIQRFGPREDQTAGAVGLVRTDDQLIVAVANWDSRDVDFYRSAGGPPESADCRMTPVVRWTAEHAQRDDWQPDQLCGSWQNINLLRQADGRLFLAGLHRGDDPFDVADLYQVQLDGQPPQVLTKCASRRREPAGRTSFINGAGLMIRQNRLWTLATERNLGSDVQIRLIR